jgi:hypothetical protein
VHRKLQARVDSLADVDANSADQQRLLDRSFQLKEEEDALVAVVLGRGDLSENCYPFDPYAVPLPPPSEGSSADGDTEARLSLAEVDARLLELAMDHEWDDDCSMLDADGTMSSSVGSVRAIAKDVRRVLRSTSGATSTTYSGCVLAAQQGSSGGWLPVIPEDYGSDVTGSLPGGASAAGEGATEQQKPRRRKEVSGRNAMDYLRPLREERDLQRLCALYMKSLRDYLSLFILLHILGWKGV